MVEIGEYPVAFYYHSRCIQYWLKIIRVPDHRYPKVCYSMLRVLNVRCRITWASHVGYIHMVLVLCGLAKLLVMFIY